MDPEEAWRTLDEITNFDATYDPKKTKRGLYQISPEVDKDVRAQFQDNEVNRLKKLVSSLKAFQLCHSMDHSASSCTNMNQVRVAERYVEEEAKYARDARNPNQSYQARNTSYPSWDNSIRQGQGQSHASLPYRPPGY